MKKRFCWRLATSAVLMAGIGFAGPASSDDTDRPGYTEKDAAYYLPEAVFEIVRPGVEAEFIELEIPADLLTEVTFSVKDPSGDPLVPDGSDCRTAVDIRWYMAFIPAGEFDKVNYFGATGRDSGGSYTDLGGGVYIYKFGTALPADYDVDATHTLAFTARRDLRHPLRGGGDGCFAPIDLGRTSDNVVHNFVPSEANQPRLEKRIPRIAHLRMSKR